jgi:type II secretory pathway component PulK
MRRHCNQRQDTTARAGFVLVYVLWVLAILTVITLGFGRRASLDARAARFGLDQAEALYMARGGVHYGLAQVRLRREIAPMIRSFYVNDPTYGVNRDQIEQIDIPVSILGRVDMKELFADQFDGRLENDRCEVLIEDEERRIGINHAPRELLEEIEGMSFRTAGAIYDRIHGLDGDPATPFTVVEELLFMRGVDEDDWVGDDSTPGLMQYFTVYGDGKINFNTASPEVLALVPDLDKGLLDDLIAYRAGKDGKIGTADDRSFDSLDAVSKELGISMDRLAPLAMYCKVSSQYFRIRGVATRRQGRVHAECVAVCFFDEDEESPTHGQLLTLDWREQVSGS